MAGTSYTRQSTFIDGDTITAALFNDEYNQLVNAFSYASSGTTGHQHDGTAGEGGNIHTIGDQDFLNKIVVDSTNNRWGVYVEVSGVATEQIRIQDGAIVPVTDNDIDLGTSSLEFKDLYLDGTANIDSLVADTADINAGTIDGTAIGATSASTGAFTTLTASGATTLSGTLSVEGNTTLGNAATDTVTFTADVASNILPSADSTYDLGDGSTYWANAYIDAVTTTGNVSIGGNLTVTGNATIAGNLTFGDAATDTVAFSADVASNLLPSVDGTYSLGAVGSEWQNLYIDGTANIDSLVADTADINAGTIDNTTIGATTASTGNFSTLSIGGTAITSTAAELNLLDGVTATTTEINYLDGVTSNIQTQLDALQDSDADLTAIAALSPTDGNFIVGNGTTWVAESGATARASLGLTIGTDVQAYDADTAKLDVAQTFTASQSFGAGIDVTGTVTADELVINAAGSQSLSDIEVNRASTGSYPVGISMLDSGGTRGARIEAGLNSINYLAASNGTSNYSGVAAHRFYSSGNLRMNIDGPTGDISFYDSAGSSQSLFWDASAESLGIGTTSPNAPLSIEEVNTSVYSPTSISPFSAQVRNDSATTGSIAGIRLVAENSSGSAGSWVIGSLSTSTIYENDLIFQTRTGVSSYAERMRIDNSGNVGIGVSASIGVSSSSNASGDLVVGTTTGGTITLTRESESYAQNDLIGRIDWFNEDNSGEGQNVAAYIGAYAAGSLGDDAYLKFNTVAAGAGGADAGESMRIDESGNLLVGTTDTDTQNNNAGSSADNGFVYNKGSGGYFNVARVNGTVAYYNRTGTDGNIVDYRKNGTSVATIGVAGSGTQPYFSRASIGGIKIGVDGSTPLLIPCDSSGTSVNGGADLGTSSNNFRNLYLSGTVIGSGDVGFGVTSLETTSATRTALTLDNSFFAWGRDSYNEAGVAQGSYRNSAGNDEYRTTGVAASQVSFSSGTINLQVAASGTNGNTISWTDGLVVDNSGNVGIGTSSPNNLLDVAGSSSFGITLTDTDTSTQASISTNDNGNLTLSADVNNIRGSSALVMRVDASEAARIDSSRNFGIGTSSPAYRLDTQVSSTTWAARVLNTNANGAGLLVRTDSTNNSNVLGVYGNGAYRMMVKADGNVGIGTSSPTEKLDVSGTIKATNIQETVYALSGTALDAGNGGIQTKTLAANTTFTDSMTSGEALVLQLEAGASYTVTWPTMTWVSSGGNVAPTLTAKDTIVLWKVSTTLYGAYVGSYV